MALSGGHLENNLLNEAWWQDTALFLMIDCPNPQVSFILTCLLIELPFGCVIY